MRKAVAPWTSVSLLALLAPLLLWSCEAGTASRHDTRELDAPQDWTTRSGAAAETTEATAPIGLYRHDRFNTEPDDQIREFEAFVLSFDGADDDECLAVPEWVAYELRRTPPGLGEAPERPAWTTDDELHALGIAPNDDSYRGSGYSRGHMCMKSHAHRIGDNADRETHTLLNACPQLQSMNNGAWKAVEELTGLWADRYGTVWIVCGPVFFSNQPRRVIGDVGEVPVAIPEAFFKVVVRENGEGLSVLSFLIPMEGDETIGRSTAPVTPYLTSVDVIEALTGLDLLTDAPGAEDLEKRVFTTLWDDPALGPAVARAPPQTERVTGVVTPPSAESVPQVAAPQPPKPIVDDAPVAITVYVTKTGGKYHRAGCRYLSRSSIPIDLTAASRRYSPCSACRPPVPK